MIHCGHGVANTFRLAGHSPYYPVSLWCNDMRVECVKLIDLTAIAAVALCDKQYRKSVNFTLSGRVKIGKRWYRIYRHVKTRLRLER